MIERTRIAPTPSGYLHNGNGVAFLVTAQLAQLHKASLRLRIDDLDAERGRPAYVEDIFSSLSWLGIEWGEGPRNAMEQEREHSQLRRISRYQEFIDILKEQGDLYACTCSRSALRELARRGMKNCDCRSKQRSFKDAEATWRLHMPSDAVVRMEQVFGSARMLTAADLLTDPVIRQRASEEGGGRPAYQIASLVDDVDHGSTFIVRGEDLLSSTACQLYLADRLGLETFKRVRFLHHPLITDALGHKLSKSEGAEALRTMRANGTTPTELNVGAARMLAVLQQGDVVDR